jgi:RNA recognition motif-containing protein
MNSTKLYVGGLPYSVTDAQLEEMFSAHGTVESARVITDRMTGRSRGFGFVEMQSQAEAQAATEELNGSQVEGRTLVVNEAKPRQSTGGSNRRSDSRGPQNRSRW